ncbi:MAG: cytidine deaminase [Muribaculaceae bacterium]|nr:cytidine deaminase [Muribaculaceae bacterium]
MKEKEISIKIRECSPEELTPDRQALIKAAKEATRNSLAPYSNFHVGAAIEMADGEIFTGANQENAAFMAGTCAERSACFYAGANRPGAPFKRIAIAAWHDPEEKCGDDYEAGFQADPISPCGLCRQALLEYEHLHGPIEVLLYGRDKTYVIDSVSDLMPLSFTEF